ncbi:hypothetical protein BS50DRAFT_664453 [Corynespora cassiicola Philippines]|uniref:Uncharacterized protein n=1 Tax=Corynespora cassiicola Philippines TaxID=1448308 RepID=A0A2T2NVQ4_CORCC|nr:hypothetical protein BS50DRAFT_664453 [Corynespora cassiicola Philippines]
MVFLPTTPSATPSGAKPPAKGRELIPSVSNHSGTITAGDCYTNLSFALPTSLAFAKCLAWQQTPWADLAVDDKVVSRISESDAEVISYQLSGRLGKAISIEAIKNALYLGTTYKRGRADGSSLICAPQVFVVFPHLQRDCSRDAKFLRVWNDDVVKPAFDAAWAERWNTFIVNRHKGVNRLINAGGVHREREAWDAKEILKVLARDGNVPLTNEWPEFDDVWIEGKNHAGVETNRRRRIFDDAWRSIRGMVDGHGDLAEFQDPFLLAVSRCGIDFDLYSGWDRIYDEAAIMWDLYVDAGYMNRDSFFVELKTVLGPRADAEEKAKKWAEKEKDAWKDNLARTGFNCNFNTGKKLCAEDEEYNSATGEGRKKRSWAI